ncbi:hypothetical protein [Nocardioides nitrophenolicus]|uniref:hypothetical protein n=1 Tax=Nocardioides nitrophenolicus TaxID=60489 RepID=UPI00195A1128|nr:hypothetical protein [Nocardioides nitrophenolicus]MBM7519978.1 hypothetical protein [Nocardioides nitrophenolicus]
MSDQWRPYDPAGEQRRVRRRIGLLVVGALVVLGGAGAGITALAVNALDDDSTTTTTTTTTTTRTEVHSSTTGDVDLFTTSATDAMTAAVVEHTGSARALEVILLQLQAVITVPGDDGPRTLLWDGTSITEGGPGVSGRKPFDLGDLDGAVVRRLCGTRPLLCTVIAHRPGPGDDGAWLVVTGPSGVRLADLAGQQP